MKCRHLFVPIALLLCLAVATCQGTGGRNESTPVTPTTPATPVSPRPGDATVPHTTNTTNATATNRTATNTTGSGSGAAAGAAAGGAAAAGAGAGAASAAGSNRTAATNATATNATGATNGTATNTTAAIDEAAKAAGLEDSGLVNTPEGKRVHIRPANLGTLAPSTLPKDETPSHQDRNFFVVTMARNEPLDQDKLDKGAKELCHVLGRPSCVMAVPFLQDFRSLGNRTVVRIIYEVMLDKNTTTADKVRKEFASRAGEYAGRVNTNLGGTVTPEYPAIGIINLQGYEPTTKCGGKEPRQCPQEAHCTSHEECLSANCHQNICRKFGTTSGGYLSVPSAYLALASSCVAIGLALAA